MDKKIIQEKDITIVCLNEDKNPPKFFKHDGAEMLLKPLENICEKFKGFAFNKKQLTRIGCGLNGGIESSYFFPDKNTVVYLRIDYLVEGSSRTTHIVYNKNLSKPNELIAEFEKFYSKHPSK